MHLRKWLIGLVSVLLVFASFPTVFASAEDTGEQEAASNSPGAYSTKDEVVYVNLDASGRTKNMYVVNSFHITDSGKLVDFGDYSDVRNLTNLSKMEKTNNDEVQFEAEEKEFYYQGELGNQPLPWDISITYLLDGEQLTAEELAGQSGDLEIQITTSANENVDPVFFENYLLQISLTLDPVKFTDIQAPEGTEANEGKNKQISFMVLPDQEEELILTANVTDLEMDPIDIAAIPANIAIEDPDISNMTGDMDSLSDAVGSVNNGVKELKDGIAELNSGAKELNNGSTEYRNGISELNRSSGDLVSGSQEIRDALNQVNNGIKNSPDMPDMGELTDLPDGFREMAKGLRDAAKGLDELKKNYDAAHQALDGAIEGIPEGDINEKEIEKLYGSSADKNVIDQLIETYKAAKTVKGTYEQVKEGFDAVSGALEQSAAPLRQMAGQLEELASGVEAGMDDLEKFDALTELQDGLSMMASEYTAFHNGLVDYTEGVNTLATSYQEIDSGMNELSEGTSSLSSGADELYAGTSELQQETSDLPEEMQVKIDELMEDYANSDFEPVSFVSDKNKHIDVVQFVLQTEKIEKEEIETEEDETEESKSLWDRFLDLFR